MKPSASYSKKRPRSFCKIVSNPMTKLLKAFIAICPRSHHLQQKNKTNFHKSGLDTDIQQNRHSQNQNRDSQKRLAFVVFIEMFKASGFLSEFRFSFYPVKPASNHRSKTEPRRAPTWKWGRLLVFLFEE